MKRLIYRAQLLEGGDDEGVARIRELAGEARELLRDGKLMTIAVYRWRRHVFLYAESVRGEFSPDETFGAAADRLEDWPGLERKRKWVPMIDVFHFNEPADAEHWRRKTPVERRVGRVAHLKPEMVASYIYYHYQLQEERAFLGDKYEIIAIHENLLFGYQEFPKVIEEPVLPRKLQTKGTPEPWELSRMDLHFQPWEDGHLYFKPIETVFALYVGELE
ncbi:hypothetical protein ACFQWB_05230 [Paenibacillus thermoaerophilus]|uniref:Uncharacterized protein n=1 Tax=Paenibacillus thermoaerophilus TaxID=1215385 RepID=A0ABW2V3I1_9BACL|nr:hypothetical protein [Paenibacillus thermoaerophilus]TMV14330.1 hypothetical protein FE781_10420 [Paenibacillus thermoaerophilus]